jgi:hypothetical protein
MCSVQANWLALLPINAIWYPFFRLDWIFPIQDAIFDALSIHLAILNESFEPSSKWPSIAPSPISFPPGRNFELLDDAVTVYVGNGGAAVASLSHPAKRSIKAFEHRSFSGPGGRVPVSAGNIYKV